MNPRKPYDWSQDDDMRSMIMLPHSALITRAATWWKERRARKEPPKVIIVSNDDLRNAAMIFVPAGTIPKLSGGRERFMSELSKRCENLGCPLPLISEYPEPTR